MAAKKNKLTLGQFAQEITRSRNTMKARSQPLTNVGYGGMVGAGKKRKPTSGAFNVSAGAYSGARKAGR